MNDTLTKNFVMLSQFQTRGDKKNRRLPFVPECEEGIGHERLRSFTRTDWVESSFVAAFKGNTEFIGRTVSNRSISTLFIIALFFFSLFLLRSAYLQLYRGAGFAALAENNKTRIIMVSANRGIFFDRTGMRLTRNIPDFALAVTGADLPRNVHERQKIFEYISPASGMNVSDIQKHIERHDPYRPFLLVDHIPYERALQLLASQRSMNGIEVVSTQRRTYEMTSLKSPSHIFGYTGRVTDDDITNRPKKYLLTDMIGKHGLEYIYDDALRGIPGRREVEVDALGYEKRILSEQEPIHGANIQLTIDWSMQQKSEEIMKSILEHYGVSAGVLIASNPKNGEILSFVSLPAYDANMFARGMSDDEYRTLLDLPDHPLINRAISGEYPSGSTIKMIVAAAALQEGIVTRQTTIHSKGGIVIGRFIFPDWKASGHGATNIIKALAESVNTYFYFIGGGYQDFTGLGIERLSDYFSRFGIGGIVGIDLPSERTGFLPTPEWKLSSRHEPWYIGDTYHVSIGQGDILVTPLQVHAFTSYFAQHGISYVPHIVKSIHYSYPHEYRQDIQSRVYKKGIVSDQTTDIVREGLRAGVQSGSSRRLSLLSGQAAGKTGTAQWSAEKKPHAWFTGWYPFENPTITLTVLIEQGEEGSRSAVSVAFELLKWFEANYSGHDQL